MIRMLIAALGVIVSPHAATAAGKPLAISLSPTVQTITEGQSATLTLGKSGGNGKVSAAKVVTSDGSFSGSVVPGSIFKLPTKDDALVNGSRTITITATASTGVTAKATLTILDNDVAGPPPVLTRVCGDGSTVPIFQDCPVSTTTIGPVGEKAFDWLGVANVPSEFDPASSLHPTCDYTGGTLGCLPSSNASEMVGAFRFICNAGQVLRDDPVVYPGQPGKAHLHQFYGNLNANANSTYASLRASGASSCEGPAGAHPVNRSAYWMPGMLDGKGNVVRPDYISIYYKRAPLSSKDCKAAPIGDPSRGIGNCTGLPNGLRFLWGYDMTTSTPHPGAYFNCDGQTAQPGHYATIPEATAHCPTAQNPDGSYNRMGVVISMPDCWNGQLDSPNHQDHLANGGYGWWGYYRCPDDHPYLIPTFTLGAWFTVDANLGTWHLSSDEMHPELPAGSTFHADWFGAWDNKVEATWVDNCINKILNCAGGDLGNGTGLKQAGIWKAEPRLVPIPN